MYFTSGSDRAFEQLMQGKPGFDHYDSGEAVTPEDCGTCRFYRPALEISILRLCGMSLPAGQADRLRRGEISSERS